ncbi:MAG: flagellar basal body P-ring protein FlgI [Spirochaetales bacterium]|nr:flagellar basal body P-ring protein FlgI [Spirochaetales bacterium]
MFNRKLLAVMVFVFFLLSLYSQEEPRIMVKNLVSIEGVRDNQLSGFGLVTGLAGKGDSADSPALKKVLTNFFSKHQLAVSPDELKSKNCAVVLITADIPPFVRSGDRILAYISSLGDAKSLEGGVLLQSPLYGADNVMYAVAQGIVESTVESPNRTVAHLARGAMVERSIPASYHDGSVLHLTLNQPDFSTAFDVMTSLKEALPEWQVRIADAGALTLQVPDNFEGNIEDNLVLIENTLVKPPKNSRIVVNPRTGVVVVGADAGIGSVGVAYKGIKIEVNRPGGGADTETEAFMLNTAVRAEELVQMLQDLGLKAEGIIEILIAVDRAGALYGDLIVM